MSIELDWQEGDDRPEDSWEESPPRLPLTPDQTRPTTRDRGRRLPRRVLVLAAAILLVGAVIATTIVLLRAGRGNELARRDIEAAAQEVLAAQQTENHQLLADLQDPAARSWIEESLARQAGRWQGLPVSVAVQSVRLDDSRATATLWETFADQDGRRRWAFFRWQDPVWLLTSPWPEAFGGPEVTDAPHFHIQYRTEDGLLIGHVINLAEGSYLALCGDLHCRSTGKPMLLQLIYDDSLTPSPRPGVVALPSPWIVGVTDRGVPHQTWEADLIRRLAQALALAKAPVVSPALGEAIGEWAATSLDAMPDQAGPLLLAAHQAGALPALADSWATIAIHDYREDSLAMAQVQSLLAYLQQTAAGPGVGRLLEAMQRTPDRLELAHLLEAEFDANLVVFEIEWLRWLVDQADGGRN